MGAREHDAPTFPFYARDWIASTRRALMSDAAQADYVLLLCHQYLAGSLPADPERLRKLVGRDSAAWTGIWSELEPSFPLDGPGRRNARLERAVQERDEYLTRQSKAGKISAQKAVRSGGRFTNRAPTGSPTSPPTETPAEAPAEAPAADQVAVAVAFAVASSVAVAVAVEEEESKHFGADAPELTLIPSPDDGTRGVAGAGRRAFRKPTRDEVATYCAARRRLGKRPVDPDTFCDHYEAKGWVIGKSPMKDWQAAVRTWERGGDERRANGDGKLTPAQIGAFAQHLREQEAAGGEG